MSEPSASHGDTFTDTVSTSPNDRKTTYTYDPMNPNVTMNNVTPSNYVLYYAIPIPLLIILLLIISIIFIRKRRQQLNTMNTPNYLHNINYELSSDSDDTLFNNATDL
jgi:heme/copper-type cytochrome/quinol oxidase subunit 2